MSETALTALSKIRIRHMVDEDIKNAKLVEKLTEDPNKLLGAILIGNNIVNIGASALATSIAVAKWGESGVGIVTIVLTIVVLIFGEITPKSIAKQKSESVSLAVSRPISLVVKLLKPFIALFTGISAIFIKLVGCDPKANEPFITEEELKTMVGVSEEEGVLEDVEKENLSTKEKVIIPKFIPRTDFEDMKTEIIVAINFLNREQKRKLLKRYEKLIGIREKQSKVMNNG